MATSTTLIASTLNELKLDGTLKQFVSSDTDELGCTQHMSLDHSHRNLDGTRQVASDLSPRSSEGLTPQDELLLSKCPECDGMLDIKVIISPSGTVRGRTTAPYGAAESGSDVDVERKMSMSNRLSPTLDNVEPRIGERGYVPQSLQDKVWLCLEITETECPPYPLVSRITAGVGLLFILLSVVNFAIETYPQYHLDEPPELFFIEAICIAFFSCELLLRSLSTPDKSVFFRDAFTIIDILSIIPFYIGLIVGEGAANGLLIVRILRLMRVFRVFKVSKYNDAVTVVFGSLQKSTEGLYLLLFLILLSTMIFSSAMYFAEREGSHYNQVEKRWYRSSGPNGTGAVSSPFQSIVHTSWWCLVTLTTVGYGDDVPTSTAGKVVAVVTMLCGTLVIAFPMVIIGQNFQEQYLQYKRKKREHRRRGAGGGLRIMRGLQQRRDDDPELALPTFSVTDPPSPIAVRSALSQRGFSGKGKDSFIDGAPPSPLRTKVTTLVSPATSSSGSSGTCPKQDTHPGYAHLHREGSRMRANSYGPQRKDLKRLSLAEENRESIARLESRLESIDQAIRNLTSVITAVQPPPSAEMHPLVCEVVNSPELRSLSATDRLENRGVEPA